ncbi:MAG: hypothetical protein KatS3mg115_2580 [Candidatus Poribacteria bacterium]|nr:MAG: hypothetical protein KatS3mg115_2580 [Candidatus Poribacteria bacterium]
MRTQKLLALFAVALTALWVAGCSEEVDLTKSFQTSLAGVAITHVAPVDPATNTVAVEFALMDELGNSNLDPSQFTVRIYERSLRTGERELVFDSSAAEEVPAASGVLMAPQRGNVQPRPRPLNLAMVLDRSGSMNQNEQLTMEAAALRVLENLRNNDKVEVINVSTEVHVDASFRGANSQRLVRAITEPSIRHGWTKIFDAILQGAQDAANHQRRQVDRGQRRIAVFTVTDGEDNRSDVSVADVVNACVGLNAPVFIIGIADPSDPTDLQTSDLQQIADGTGGRLILTTDPLALSTILTGLQDAVGQPFVAEYESPHADEGEWEVEVEVERNGEVFRNGRRVVVAEEGE